LIAAGVARGGGERTPSKVAGAGLAPAAAGIEAGWPARGQARETNIGLSPACSGRPWLRVKVAASLTAAHRVANGVSQWITDRARQDGHHWRASPAQ
jgi:diaminohydroxyphosphoribosylaminopyrimidine deaminase/5-amino-6-(5-phosphoribosylamino)uracil reductase